jgi:hypothetical protein
MNYLDPVLVDTAWSSEEDQLLNTKYKEYGSQWQVIAMFFPTRSRNQIKNRWHTLHKSLLAGIPPAALPPPVEPVDDELCELSLETRKVCKSLFSESRTEELVWGDFFTSFF